jgi:predicted transcriptional regulator
MTCLRGESNGMAKLREAEVLQIYDMAWSSHYTQAEIAKMFGVGRECVSYIKLAKNWRWLTETQKENDNGSRSSSQRQINGATRSGQAQAFRRSPR